MNGFAWDFTGEAVSVECEVVVIKEAAFVPFDVGRFVKPWGSATEDAVKC